MPLNQVRPNTPLNIPASSWNEIVRHVRGHTQNGGGGAGDIPPRSLDGTQQTLVKVQNNSGSALARYGILGISGFKVDPGSIGGESQQWLQQPIITGTTPAIDDHRSKFVVAIEPIANGEYGWACASGIVQVKVNIVDADHHGYAELKDADATQLESGLMGSARILQKQSGTGTKWALVRLGENDNRTLNAEITGESTGGGKYSAKLLEFDGSGSLVDASPAVTWTETIIEVNGRQGIPTGTRIEMTLIGTDGSGNEWFSFEDDSADDGTPDSGPSYTHAEHAKAADTSTWDRTDQGTDRGVKITVQTGERYDHNGDEKLYAYLRDLTFDADGHLTDVSAETRVEIEAPEDC